MSDSGIVKSRQLQPYRLALEGPPYDGAIANCELCEAVSREDAALGDVKGVHDGNDEVAAGACALDVGEELVCHEIVHVATEERWVQGDPAFQIVEKEHDEV